MLKENIFCAPWSHLLFPFSLIYKVSIDMWLLAYKKGILKPKSLPAFVVSVGNITVGGTGKTPTVIEIAKWAKKKGYNVAVLSRGYGGRYKGWLLVSDGKKINACSKEAGDEPYLMARNLEGVPIAVAKNRYKIGIYLIKNYTIDFFILDDGFQYLKLKRDINILLLNGEKPFGNMRLLPAGPLREPINQISRADIYLITESDEISDKLSRMINSKNIFFAKHIPDKIIFPNSIQSINILKDKKVIGFAGISSPERFKNMLYKLGAKVVFFKEFPDHYWFKKKEIEEIIKIKEKEKADYILTTEKDWVRIMDKKWDIGYIKTKLEIRNREIFFRLIDEAYKRKRNKTDLDKSY